MKKLSMVAVFCILLAVTSHLFAGSIPGYQYTVSGYKFTVGGLTSVIPSGGYIVSKTFSGVPVQTPAPPANFTFQKLVLRTKVYLNPDYPPVCPAFKYRDTYSAGNCQNCTYTEIDNTVPPPGSPVIDWDAISKHKLADTRATNSAGNSPSPFYTELEQSGTPSTQGRFKGGIGGCDPNPLEPDDD